MTLIPPLTTAQQNELETERLRCRCNIVQEDFDFLTKSSWAISSANLEQKFKVSETVFLIMEI
jgi:hypothetical protein